MGRFGFDGWQDMSSLLLSDLMITSSAFTNDLAVSFVTETSFLSQVVIRIVEALDITIFGLPEPCFITIVIDRIKYSEE